MSQVRLNEGSPGVPDSDLTVVVSTDDAVLRTDQVAAVRRHISDLHTCMKKFTSISNKTVVSVVRCCRDSQAALWRSHRRMVLSALPVTTW